MPYTFAGQVPGVTKWLNDGHASAGSRGAKCAGLSSVIRERRERDAPPSTRSVQAPAVTTTVSARTDAVGRVHRDAVGILLDAQRGVCQRTLATAGRDPPPSRIATPIRPLELLQATDARATPASGEHGVFEPHARPAPRRFGAVEQLGGMPRAAAARGSRSDPRRCRRAQRRRRARPARAGAAAARRPGAPSASQPFAGPREQIEVVLVGVGVVEVAGRAVRRAARCDRGANRSSTRGRSPRRLSAHAVERPITPPPTTTKGTCSLIPRSSQAVPASRDRCRHTARHPAPKNSPR